jgi:hypothetical protein
LPLTDGDAVDAFLAPATIRILNRFSPWSALRIDRSRRRIRIRHRSASHRKPKPNAAEPFPGTTVNILTHERNMCRIPPLHTLTCQRNFAKIGDHIKEHELSRRR